MEEFAPKQLSGKKSKSNMANPDQSEEYNHWVPRRHTGTAPIKSKGDIAEDQNISNENNMDALISEWNNKSNLVVNTDNDNSYWIAQQDEMLNY